MASSVRFRTVVITTNNNVDGILITPTLFDATFLAGQHRFRSITFATLTTATALYMKGDIADDWVDITELLTNGAAGWLVNGIDSFYIKSNNLAGTIGIIVYITDARQSGY